MPGPHRLATSLVLTALQLSALAGTAWSQAAAPEQAAPGPRMRAPWADNRESAAPANPEPLPVVDRPHNHPGLLVLGGAAGFAASVGGAVVLARLHGGDICGDSPCGFYWGVLFFALSEPILVPMGVHLANGGKGDFGVTMGLSLAAALASGLVINRLGPDNGEIVIPLSQIAAAVIGEVMSSR